MWCNRCKLDHPKVGNFGEFEIYACPKVDRDEFVFSNPDDRYQYAASEDL
jgi:hypothetical protein